MLRRIHFFLTAALFAASGVLSTAQVLIDKRITIQPIQVRSTDGTVAANPSLTLFEAEADKIFSQAGIDVAFNSWLTYDNSSFLNLSSSFGAGNSLEALRGTSGQAWSTPGVGGSMSANVIRIFFVQTIDSDTAVQGYTIQSSYTDFGLGPTINQQVFSAIANSAISNNRIDTIAHEIGHALSLNHATLGAGGANNLMTDGSSRSVPSSVANIYPDGSGLDRLTTGSDPLTSQIARLRAMPAAESITPYYYTAPIPEPAHYALMAGASLLLVGLLRRRRGN